MSMQSLVGGGGGGAKLGKKILFSHGLQENNRSKHTQGCGVARNVQETQ